jgi:uncharacterized SAM-binding protein YcdF (DUF218 family)
VKKQHVALKLSAAVLVSLIILGVAGRNWVLTSIGSFLIVQHEPRKADVMVVLNGHATERALAAVDLYKAGYANVIALARGRAEFARQELQRRTEKVPDRKIFFQWAIESMGVPENSFILVGDGAQTTYDEAKIFSDLVRKQRIKKILLVTSKWHSRRAYYTFGSAFGGEHVEILVYPSPYDGYEPGSWWKSQSQLKRVAGEYIKLMYYFISFRIDFRLIFTGI